MTGTDYVVGLIVFGPLFGWMWHKIETQRMEISHLQEKIFSLLNKHKISIEDVKEQSGIIDRGLHSEFEDFCKKVGFRK